MAVALILSAVTGRGSLAQSHDVPSAQPMFRSGVSLVVITATVEQRNGSYMPDLTSNDFSVSEEGVPQQIAFFASADVPMDLVLMIDTSASMASHEVEAATRLDIARGAVLTLIRPLGAADTAAIVGFGERTEVHQRFTSNHALLENAVARLRVGGATSLYTSLYVALKQFAAAPRGGAFRRRAIVLITDGEDTKSLVPYDAVIELARALNVAIYTIVVRAGALTSVEWHTSEAEYEMRAFARETGAQAFFVDSMSDVESACRRIAGELAHQYVLAYTPVKPRPRGTFTRLSVSVNRPWISVRARSGYLAGR